MHTLGHADDAALVDQGCAAGVQHASDRSAHGHSKRIEEGRRHDYLYQENESSARSNTVTISGEASDACKFTCSRLHCGFKFYCRHGMRAHAGICEWENELPIHRILDIKGPTCSVQRIPHQVEALFRQRQHLGDKVTHSPRGDQRFRTSKRHVRVRLTSPLWDLKPPVIQNRKYSDSLYKSPWYNEKTVSICSFGRLSDKTFKVEKLEKQQK